MASERKVVTDDWVSVKAASIILGVHVSAVNDAVVRYDVPHKLINGVRAYSVPDLERAAAAIAAMRQIRKPRQQPETANA